jgi:anti-sigma factor RsiW
MRQLVVERDALENGHTPALKAHGTDEQLELYALGRLADTDHAILEEHLIVCAACRAKLDGIGDFAFGMQAAGVGATAMDQIGNPGFLDGVRALLRRPAVSMSLAFVLLLVIVGIFSTGRNELPQVATLQLTSTRGAMPVTVPARSYDLQLSDGPREGGPFRVEVLNPAGGVMWANLAQGGPAGIKIDVTQRLTPGDYFVRVSTADGKLEREYGFRVR